MTTKFLEIRDRATTIPAMAIELKGSDSPIAYRAGYGIEGSILLINLGRVAVEYDPYEWDLRYGRTMRPAHLYIQEHWNELTNGSVVDVEYILGETATPKEAECV